MSINQAYSSFAQVYDSYMAHVNYELWVEKLLEYSSKHTSIPIKKIHELACGTGNITKRLYDLGYDIEASDLSDKMLKVAESKLPKHRLSQKDMLTRLSENTYNLILCLFDSVNYLNTIDKLILLMKNSAQALVDNGLFIFDISTVRNSIDNFSDLVDIVDSDDVYLVHQAEYDKIHRKQLTTLTMFFNQGGCYHRYNELHHHQIYLVSEILQCIEISGIELKGIYDLHRNDNLMNNDAAKLDMMSERLFFVLKKNHD